MEKINACVRAVREKTDFVPRVAVVLGSGLGGFAENMEAACEFSFAALPHFPVSTIEGHAGRLFFGNIAGVPVVLMQGRVHFYEGYPMEAVVFPVRLMRALGAETLLLTNAAGGIRPDLSPGSLMVIRDHISSFVPSPLRGKNLEMGARFPDMSAVYSGKIRSIIGGVAKEKGIEVREGVYLQAAGPQYETPAEIQMFARLGADAVGMSTAVEAIAAVHAGMSVGGISCISNFAAGLGKAPLSHAEVKKTAEEAGPRFESLMLGVIAKL